MGEPMAYQRGELRAFPRLSCGWPAVAVVAGLETEGQVIDVSQGGCKLLPSRLEPLVENGIQAGAAVLVTVEGVSFPGRLVWATPNFSALGCAFDQPVADEVVAWLGKGAVAAE